MGLRQGGEAGGLAGQEKSALIQKRSETRTYLFWHVVHSKTPENADENDSKYDSFLAPFSKASASVPILTRKECFQNVLITRFSVYKRQKRIKNQYVIIRKHFSVAGP